MDTIGL